MDVINLTRNQEHKLIMYSLYDALTYIDLGEEVNVEEIMNNIFDMPYEDIPVYSKKVIINALKYINDIISVLQANMKKWKFDRLNRLERAILIMSYADFTYVKESDKKVVIDLAIRFSKTFLDKDDYKFVNAILDNVLC